VLRTFLAQAGSGELLDRSFTIAASAFVALIPLILLITGAFGGQNGGSAFAAELIRRLGLAGAAAQAVTTLLAVHSGNFYLLGALVIAFSVFSLARRVARAYCDIWQVERLRAHQQWRGVAWVLLLVAMVLCVSPLRDRTVGARAGVVALVYAAIFLVWLAAEALAQRLLTCGQVPWRRVGTAAAAVATGRLAVAVWVSSYVSGSLTKQAELYGPVGVVFSLFTLLFIVAIVTLAGTLLASVVTADTPASA